MPMLRSGTAERSGFPDAAITGQEWQKRVEDARRQVEQFVARSMSDASVESLRNLSDRFEKASSTMGLSADILFVPFFAFSPVPLRPGPACFIL
jgi:hypothetical protein